MSWKLLVLTILQAAVALVFLKGFLLTRVELPDVSHCQGAGCSSQQPTAYSKAVVLIVDAVRYDFLCGQSIGNGLPPASLMPKTLHWAHAGVSCVLILEATKLHRHKACHGFACNYSRTQWSLQFTAIF